VTRLRPWIELASGVACWAMSGRPALAAGEGGIDFGDAGVAVAAVLIFLVLFLVLRRYAWKPILTQLQNREKTIADSLSAAEERQKKAQEALADVQARLDNVEEEGRQILARTRQEGQDAKEQLLAEARQEVHKLSEEQRREIERAKQDALRELYQSAADVAAEMAGQVLRRRLSAEDQRRILSGSLDDIGRQGDKTQ
jgi:F-type H+-transporting ATPase subunit b